MSKLSNGPCQARAVMPAAGLRSTAPLPPAAIGIGVLFGTGHSDPVRRDRWTNKFNVIAASAAALACALGRGDALAHGTLTGRTATYNAASVAAAGGKITVPWGGTASAIYTVTALDNGTTTSLEVNSRFTVTLPAGFTFASSPSLTTGGGFTTGTTLISGGSGSQSATFQIGSPAVAGGNTPLGVGGTLALNQVSVSDATALETPGAMLSITVQSTNNANLLNNDALPVEPLPPLIPPFGGPVCLPDKTRCPIPHPHTFMSDTGVVASFTGGSGNFIDLAPPSLGTLFGTGTGADTTNVDIGTLTLAPSGSLAANGSPGTLSTADDVSLTFSGILDGITNVYITPLLDETCVTKTQTTASGNTTTTVTTVTCGKTATITTTTTNTVTKNLLSIQAIGAVGVTGVNIIWAGSGTTLLTPNPLSQGGVTVTYAPGPGTTDFLGGAVTNPGDGITYNHGTLINVTDFLTGSDAGYTSLVRFSNGSSATNTLFAIAEPDTGGLPLVGELGTIGPGIGTIFTEAQIGAATGLSLANSGQRAALTIIAIPGGPRVTASALLVNPGGLVDNVN